MAVSIRDYITTINVMVMDVLVTGRLLIVICTNTVCVCMC